MSLVTDRSIRQVVTAHRECSAARAPVRALAAYLETFRVPVSGGSWTKFKVVRDCRAEPEDLAKYPGAAVFHEGEIQYGAEDGSLEPIYDPSGDLPDGVSLFMPGEVKVTLQVHVWTNEDEHRELVAMMMEDGLAPVEWMSGFMLTMPHYHGLRATFLLLQASYEDAPDDDQRRYRKMAYRLQATCPHVRVLGLARLHPRASVEVSNEPV